MQRADEYTSLLPCQQDDLSCDQKLGNGIAHDVYPMAFAGPDDYIFDSDLFDFMNQRYCNRLASKEAIRC